MKMIIVALAIVALAAAVPVAEVKVSQPVPIIRSDYNQSPDGGYDFFYESGDGSSRQESAVAKEVLDEDKKPHIVLTVRGIYNYINSLGEPESITYFADETGFHAEGKSIPIAARR